MNNDRLPWLATAALVALVLFSEVNATSLGGLGQGPIRWALLAVVWVLPLVLFVVRSPGLAEVITRPPLSWTAAWMVWTLVAAAWSVSSLNGSGMLIAVGIVSCWLFSACFVSLYGWTRWTTAIAWTCLVFLLGSMAYSVVGAQDVAWLGSRLAGFSWSPTHLGRIGAIAIVLGVLVFPRSRRNALLGAACIGTGAVAVVLSETRTALIGLAGVAGFAIIRHWRGKPHLAAVSSGFAMLAVVVGVVLLADGSRDLATGTGRTDIWWAALHRVVDVPLTGFGTAAGEVVFDDIARDGDLAWRAFTAHNAFLHVLFTQGMIGLGLVVAACVSYVAVARRVPDLGRDSLVLFLFINGLTEALIEQPSLPIVVLAGAFAAVANDAAARRGGDVLGPQRSSTAVAGPRRGPVSGSEMSVGHVLGSDRAEGV
ncbi:O-antigen ligase family protein [Saccharopolyspora sp. NPDC002376]